jgi:site-specific DNA-methyltransferase (adenine-specific)/site-specific DNA-methyltransferase (cytosine-N4-specific)
MIKIQRITLDALGVHQAVKKVSSPRLCAKMKYSLKRFGQRNTIKVIPNEDSTFDVLDGIKRLTAARELNNENPGSFTELNCEILDRKSDTELIDDHIVNNTVVKRNFTELYLQLKHILDPMGIQRGKKRVIEFEDGMVIPESTKMDRMEWATIQIESDFGSKTLRKLIAVFEDEEFLPKQVKEDLIKSLDSGEITIHGAYRVLKLHMQQKRDEEAKKKVFAGLVNLKTERYKLFNKSSMNMDEVEDNSIDLALHSPPYYDQRDYRNQDELKHGQEATPEEYIENQIKFCSEVYKKLRPGGVMVIIFGDSYKGGYQAIFPRLYCKLMDEGWLPTDINMLPRENPLPQPHHGRFQPGYEVGMALSKPGGEITDNDVLKPSKDVIGGLKKSKMSKKGVQRFYISKQGTPITNVIPTPLFNKKEFKEIDPTFQHDAPASVETYEKFIKKYTNPGDTVLDIYLGSGTVSVALKMGRNIIGYDVDAVSIEFSAKRCQYFLNQEETEFQMAA